MGRQLGHNDYLGMTEEESQSFFKLFLWALVTFYYIESSIRLFLDNIFKFRFVKTLVNKSFTFPVSGETHILAYTQKPKYT